LGGSVRSAGGVGDSGIESGGVRLSGTVTFLFTDIEGSTQRWQADSDAADVNLPAAHNHYRSVTSPSHPSDNR
jgi:class 3 adenylate cyclase